MSKDERSSLEKVQEEWRKEQKRKLPFAILILPLVAIAAGWVYFGYLQYTYMSLRAETLKEVHAIAAMNIIEAEYIADLPPGPTAHCFSIKEEAALAALSARLAAADDGGNTDHAYLEVKFSLFLVTAEAGRVRFKGKIYQHAPSDVFLWSGIIEGRIALDSEYWGHPVRVPGLADMLLDRVDENNCPRL